jgi:hypothetical protein
MSFLNDFFGVCEADVDEMDRIYADYLSLDQSHDVELVKEAHLGCSATEMCQYMMRSSIDCIKTRYRKIVEEYDFACLEDWPDEDGEDVWLNFMDSHYAGFLSQFINDTSPGALTYYGGAEGVVAEMIRQQMDRRIRGLASKLGIQPDPFGRDASEEMYQLFIKFIPEFDECDLDRFYDPDTLTYGLPEGVAKQIAQVTCIALDLKGNPLS